MIYIEVRFGTINGNAMTVDSSLSTTSTNPVRNSTITAELQALRNQLDSVVGGGTKEVVNVSTYSDLADIDEPQPDVIYITDDTNKLYIYKEDDDEFAEVTNDAVGNIIYVTDLDSILDMSLSSGMYIVSLSKRMSSGVRNEVYSLSVNQSHKRGGGRIVTITQMALADNEGWAENETITTDPAPATIVAYFDGTEETKTLIYDKTVSGWIDENNPNLVYSVQGTTIGSIVNYNGIQVATVQSYTPEQTGSTTKQWVWHKYSYDGHIHTTDEINGLTDAIDAATVTKQNAAGNTDLNTADKSIVGAINEVHDELDGLVHQFTIDFQNSLEIVQMHIFQAEKFVKIKTANVSVLKYSVNGGAQQTINLTNGEWTGALSMPADALLVWQIGRTNEGEIAAISIRYEYNS